MAQSKPRIGWADLSLVRQFALAGGVVMLLAMLAVGSWISRRIEVVVVDNTASATALYMESFIAPLTQDLAAGETLSAGSRAAIEALLDDIALGERVVSFKIWGPGGLVVEASNPALVGQRFAVTEELSAAWAGGIHASFEDLADLEDEQEAALGLPLLEIYSPIRQRGSARIIAVAEFYEVATQLKSDLVQARLNSWAAVALVMALIGASLFAIVLRGSRTIDRQLVTLKHLSEGNIALRLRVQGAAARFSAVNDQALRRIGADLHDGPAQLMGFAALRLDALRGHLGSAAARAELDGVERAVKDSIVEIRNISRGLSLPDIDRRAVGDLVQLLCDAHAARTATGVANTCDLGPRKDLPMAVKICIYRVVQEGLNNAWRHADGLGQEVRLVVAGEILTLQVLDRGPGPQVEAPGEDEGLGLAGLRDRVESLGGHIELKGRASGGAALVMTMDLRGAA